MKTQLGISTEPKTARDLELTFGGSLGELLGETDGLLEKGEIEGLLEEVDTDSGRKLHHNRRTERWFVRGRC